MNKYIIIGAIVIIAVILLAFVFASSSNQPVSNPTPNQPVLYQSPSSNPPSSNPPSSNSVFLGCYRDTPDRILKDGLAYDDHSKCAELAKNYKYYGLQNCTDGKCECWASNTFNEGGEKVQECKNDLGGPWSMGVYKR